MDNKKVYIALMLFSSIVIILSFLRIFLSNLITVHYIFILFFPILAIILLPGEVIDLIFYHLRGGLESLSKKKNIGKYIGYAERLMFSAILIPLISISRSLEDAIESYFEIIKFFSLIIALKGLYRFGDKERADWYILGSLLSLSLSMLFGILFLILAFYG